MDAMVEGGSLGVKSERGGVWAFFFFIFPPEKSLADFALVELYLRKKIKQNGGVWI